MKIVLLLDNPGDSRSGYLNVDPFAPPDDPVRLKGDVSDLSHTVDDGEAVEIIAHDVLDYYGRDAADAVLANWLKKLARGGTLTLSVVDLREVSRAVLAGSVSAEDANELLHGKQERAWQYRKASFTLTQLSEVLSNLGYKVLAQRVQNYRAVITVQRVN